MSAQSRSSRHTHLKRALIGCCGAIALTSGAARAATPADASQAPGIEDVVVTASRREENVRDIPTAISAYGGDRLAAQHVQTMVDLVTSSPNIQLGANATNANIAIRGIGNDLTTAGSDPGVAFHVDGVYLANTGLAVSSLLDVNRVEILRGPQGTLFGRNATGGAVNIIPNIPSRQLSYGGEASVGVSPFEDHLAGFLSGPLNASATLMGRLSVQQTFNDGFSKNLLPGGPNRLDDTDNWSGRAQLLWQPTEAFSTRLSLEYQKAGGNGPALYNVGTPDPSIPLPSQIAGQPTGDIQKRQTYANQSANDLEAWGAALITQWNLGGGNLKATLSANTSDQMTQTDGDGTPVDFTHTTYRQRIDQRFAEVIYSSSADAPFTYVLGANYFRESEFQNVNVPISFLPAPGVDLRGRIVTHSYAAFAHGQYAFANGLKLFAGARFTKDEKRISESNNFVGALAQAKSWTRPTFEVGASYAFSPAVTGYLKYSTGYKGGGFSSGGLSPAFNPETDKALEGGLKGSYFDGRLQANLAVFHISYNDLQVSQTIGVLSAVTNAARATVDGFEIETVERLTPDLRLEISGGYLNARFNQFNTADSARPGLGLLDLSGNLLPQAPHVTASAAGFYDLPLGIPGKTTLGAQYEWKSRVYFSEFNIPLSSQKPVGKLNLTLNYTSQDKTWGAGLYARNVTDEVVKSHLLVVSALLGSLGLAQLQPGREIGFQIHYRY